MKFNIKQILPRMRCSRAKPARRSRMSRFRLTRKGVLAVSFTAAALVVTLVTVYAMIMPAVTATKADCGVEEHTHSGECYSKGQRLVCTNTDKDHVHNDECYEEQKILTCTKEQHKHSDECYVETGDTLPSEAAAKKASGTESAESTGSAKSPEEKSTEATKPAGAKSGEPTGLDVSGYIDFEEYMRSVGGSIESALYDKNYNLIENIYEASGDGYTYELSINSDFIAPGTYYYPLPSGLSPEEGFQTGDISHKNEVIGSFRIPPNDHYILFIFNEDINDYQDIQGEISFGCSFAERMKPSVSKSGYLISPDNVMDGYFHFKIQAKIPAASQGIPKREWKLLDHSKTVIATDENIDSKEWDHDFGNEVNAPNTNVYISYGDVSRYELHSLSEVYADESVSIAYYADSQSKALYLVNRCDCDGKRCVHVDNDKCGCELLKKYSGWCTCWNLAEDAFVDVEYKNAVNGSDGSPILKDQKEIAGAESTNYKNTATLVGTYSKNGSAVTERKMAEANVDFSAFIGKEETEWASRGNGFKSTFRVLLNPEKFDLSKMDTDCDGNIDTEIVVSDNMTNMKYIAGSMTITAENADGEKFELVSNTDFTVGAVQTESGTNLTVVLKKLGPYTYELAYQGQTYWDDDNNPVTISNDVSVNFFGGEDDGQTGEAGNPDYEYSRKFKYTDKWVFLKYSLGLRKVDAEDPDKLLKNAVYGLYSADGTELARAATDEKGEAHYATNVEEGLIFQNNTAYYLQEITPPENYDLNSTKYWFYFADAKDETLETRIRNEFSGVNITHVEKDDDDGYAAWIRVTDEKLYSLPETGGVGTAFMTAAGAVLLLLACCLTLCKRLKWFR